MWPPQAILVSDWSISKKSSTLKQLGQMDRNVVGSIYGRCSIGIAHSFWSVNKHGRHRQFLFLIGRFLKQHFLWNRLVKWYETWKDLYRDCSFRFDPLTWPPQAILVSDWTISKNLLLWNFFAKMKRNLVGSTYERFCIKFPQRKMKGERHRLSPMSL
jgi:hypothetical protein